MLTQDLFLTATFLKILALWNVTPCRLVNTDVSEESSVFIFGRKQSKKKSGPFTMKMKVIISFETSATVYQPI
jgi:hypothetical protein